MKNFKKGFTLIELLVVVAIIGILASVVLMVLGNAKTKGSDAAVKSNLTNALKQAEIFYNVNTASPNSYTNVCTNGTVGGIQGIGAYVLAAAKDSGLSTFANDSVGSLTTATCNDSANAWAVEVPLKTTSGQMWCIDSTGKSKLETASSLSAVNDYTCI